MSAPTDSTAARCVIVLAGGRGSRMGDVDKPGLQVGGRSLLDAALHAGADAPVVVVGPARDLPAHILQTREDPPGSGPVAAVQAGFAALDVDGSLRGDVAVLAADVPFVTAAVLDQLALARRTACAPAAFALDSAGRMQYLLGVWDAAALRESLSAATGSAMRGLVPTGALGLRVDDAVLADVDTPDDLDRARRRATPAAPRLSPPLARAALSRALRPLQSTPRPVGESVGAVLASPLRAVAPFPAFDVSAMDGYAVAGPGPWTVLPQSIAAGATIHPAVAPGQAVRIATGAMLPPGAERVIRDEDLTVAENALTAATFDRDDTRRRGSEWAADAELVAAGTPVDEAVASVARSAAVATLDVRGPLRVSVHVTGDEVVDYPTRPGTIVDTASAAVAQVLARNGCRVTTGAQLADARAAFVGAVNSTVEAEVVVLIGATGRGVADHLRAALDEAGATVIIDGVAVRPGGSLLVATVPSGPVVVGLGGNPLAAVAGAALLTPTITATLLGAIGAPPELISVDGRSGASRTDGWRIVPVTPTINGQWSMPQRIPTAHLAALVGARGFALLPPDAHDGDLVELLR